MNKTINVFPLILVFIFNIALFISTPYNKNILNIFPLSDIIWSFIYFIVVFLLFNYYIRCSFVNFTNYKKLSLIFCALLSIRIIFDFTYYFFSSFSSCPIFDTNRSKATLFLPLLITISAFARVGSTYR